MARRSAVVDQWDNHGGTETRTYPIATNYEEIGNRVYGDGAMTVPALMVNQANLIHSVTLEGEVLSVVGVNNLFGGIGGGTDTILDMPLDPVMDATELHNTEVLILRQAVSAGQHDDWVRGAHWTLEKLDDADFALASGVAALGTTSAARVMGIQIAYSAGGGNQYGSTAIWNLNDDTADVGQLFDNANDFSTGSPNPGVDGILSDVAEAASAASVEYAFRLAQTGDHEHGTTGVVSVDDEELTLTIDLNVGTWTFDDVQLDRWHVGMREVMTTAYDVAGVGSEFQTFLDGYVASVVFLLEPESAGVTYETTALPTAEIDGLESSQWVAVVGTSGNDQLSVPVDGLGILLGGAGDDQIQGLLGGVYGYGGTGNDQLIDCQFAFGGDGDDIIDNDPELWGSLTMASGGAGDDTFRNVEWAWGGAGADKFYYYASPETPLNIFLIHDPDDQVWLTPDPARIYRFDRAGMALRQSI